MIEDIETLERVAYARGDTVTCELLAELAELRAELERLEAVIDDTVTLESWERNHGPAKAYYDFFHECFEHLGAHYPCPSVTNDYDCSVVFETLDKGSE